MPCLLQIDKRYQINIDGRIKKELWEPRQAPVAHRVRWEGTPLKSQQKVFLRQPQLADTVFRDSKKSKFTGNVKKVRISIQSKQ
jgi:hypothetical protein